MKRLPLHIHTTAPLQITFEEPALCVKTQTEADRLYPLRRIERIQVSGPVEWETLALLACADGGISVHFINRHGQTRGRLVGSGESDHSLMENLQRLFNHPEWETWYRQWCWARGLQTKRYVANKLGYRYRDARDLAGLPKWCEARLTGRAKSKSIRNVLQWMHPDFYGVVTQFLQRDGLWNASPLALEEPINLAHDTTDILQWVLLVVRHKEVLSHNPNKPIGRRLVAKWFAGHTGYFKYQVSRIVNQLEIWIMETA